VLHVASARITGIFPLSGAQQQQQNQGSRKALALAPADSPAAGPEAIQSFSIKVRSYLNLQLVTQYRQGLAQLPEQLVVTCASNVCYFSERTGIAS
jgi:hypothetical protein